MKTMEELKWEEQLLFWENESKAFEAYLSADHKLKAETIHKHVMRISFLTKEYFTRYEITYLDLDGDTIVDFLGRFLISRVLNSSASDMSANLTSLKKWIQFLQQTEKITKDQYAGLYEVCKQKAYFEERFDNYMSANSDFALERWFNSNDILPYLKPSKASKRNPKPYEVDQKLLQLWMDGKTSVPRIVAEFRAFLEAVQAGTNVKLSAARHHLPRKFWKELDEGLNLQLFRKPTLNQDQEPVFQFFFYAAVVLEIADEGTILSLNRKQLANYLALTEQEQATLLLDTLWNKLNWGILEEVNEGGRPEDIQAWRRATASVLASWPVGQEHNVRQEWMKHKASGILLNSSTDVFLHAVVTVLVRFDLIKAQYPPDAEMKYASERQPAVMTVLDSGNRVFRYFVNEAAYVLGNPASVPVTTEPKIGRNDTCPCGSGKKYKKCCL